MKILNIHEVITDEWLERRAKLKQLKLEFASLETIQQKWGYLRKIYAELMPDILAASAQSKWRMIDPYFIDWAPFLSPIEYDAWQSIRNKGLPFYPQFPILNYFIDFANPRFKIGLELDGKDYHDPIKDKARDERLFEEGWRIFRVAGAECYTPFKQYEEIRQLDYENERDEALVNWLCHTSDGVIESIKIFYFRNDDAPPHLALAARSLMQHKLVNFDIVLD
jgi:very-short-patch-repair endonuclease